MSEIDDSEYIEDSELDDDVIPPISAPSYNVDDILAIQSEFKLETYDLPDHLLSKPERDYLPSYNSESTTGASVSCA